MIPEIIKNDKPISDTILSRALFAIGGGAIPVGILRLAKMPTSTYIPAAVAGAFAGITIPMVTNKLIRNKAHPEAQRELLKDESAYVARLAAPEISDLFNKQSSFAGIAAKKISGGAWKFGKTILGGLKPVAKTAPFGRKVFGTTVKGTALVGLGLGTARTAKKIVAPRSGSNYTTYLRNNILAGRIHPGQLTQVDLSGVKRLGFR